MEEYSIKFFETETETETDTTLSHGVISLKNGNEVPFLAENFFNFWFKLKCTNIHGRTKEFNGDTYTDVIGALDTLPMELMFEIRRKIYEILSEKFGTKIKYPDYKP